MLYGFLSSLYLFATLFIILLILVQKGKGGMGVGYISGQQQAIFGGSGGADFLQRLTWALGALILFGSLGLSLMKSEESHRVLTGTLPQTEQSAPQ